MSINCWEFKKCGREEGGENVEKCGVCPAYIQNAGESCWLVAGTFCDGEIQGTIDEKEQSCLNCDFYKLFD